MELHVHCTLYMHLTLAMVLVLPPTHTHFSSPGMAGSGSGAYNYGYPHNQFGGYYGNSDYSRTQGGSGDSRGVESGYSNYAYGVELCVCVCVCVCVSLVPSRPAHRGRSVW